MRRGRITAAQRQALDESRDRYGIRDQGQCLDLDRIFGRRAPRVLEIGSGMGEATLRMAEQHPENDYIAVEVHPPGVGAILRGARKHGLDNIRVLHGDIIEALRKLIPRASVDEVYVFFPDPWPKKRHHKRRLVNREFLSILLPALKSHARVFLATDWEPMAGHMRDVFDADARFENLAGARNYSPRPGWRPLTKYELRGRKHAAPIRDLSYAMSGDSLPAACGACDDVTWLPDEPQDK